MRETSSFFRFHRVANEDSSAEAATLTIASLSKIKRQESFSLRDIGLKRCRAGYCVTRGGIAEVAIEG